MHFGIDRKHAVKGRRTNSIHHNSEFKETLAAISRGGRMTKHKGVAASYAPEIGLAVPLLRSAAGGCAGVLLANHTLAISLAPAALLMSSTSAIAQDACVEVDPNTFECVDNSAPATTTQVVTGSGVSVDIQDGFDIDALGYGIDATTTGGVTITSSGSMNSITSLANGVVVDNSVAGDLILDITPSVITALSSGVSVRNAGDGLTSVTTGSTEAASVAGVSVFAEASATDLIIDTSAGLVRGGVVGVSATNYGSGVTMITTGDIAMLTGTGLAANHQGTDLIIDTTSGTIDASATAVSVSNSGTGYTRVTTGDLTGVLSVSHRGSSAEIDTRAGTASAGVIVQNGGTGPLSLTTGNVGNPSNNGIFVNNQPGSTGPVTIDTSAGAVNAAAAGIYVRGTGTGALSITTANVDAGTGAGVYARTYGASVTIDTSAGAVSSAGGYGLRAITFSPGQTDIVTGDVSGGLSAAGINAIGGTGVSFDSTGGALTGGLFGVFVRNYGSGNAYVTTADVYGNGADAIFVDTGTDAGDIIVNSAAGVAIGSADGIEVINRGTGAVSVTTGDVTGGSDIGIDLYNQSGSSMGTMSASPMMARLSSSTRATIASPNSRKPTRLSPFGAHLSSARSSMRIAATSMDWRCAMANPVLQRPCPGRTRSTGGVTGARKAAWSSMFKRTRSCAKGFRCRTRRAGIMESSGSSIQGQANWAMSILRKALLVMARKAVSIRLCFALVSCGDWRFMEISLLSASRARVTSVSRASRWIRTSKTPTARRGAEFR